MDFCDTCVETYIENLPEFGYPLARADQETFVGLLYLPDEVHTTVAGNREWLTNCEKQGKAWDKLNIDDT